MEKRIVFVVLQAVLVSIGNTARSSKMARASVTRSASSREAYVRQRLSPYPLTRASETRSAPSRRADVRQRLSPQPLLRASESRSALSRRAVRQRLSPRPLPRESKTRSALSRRADVCHRLSRPGRPLPYIDAHRHAPSRQAVVRQVSPHHLITRAGIVGGFFKNKYVVIRTILNELQTISVGLQFRNPSVEDISSKNLVKLYKAAKESSNKKPTKLFFQLMEMYDEDNEIPTIRYNEKRTEFFDAVENTETYGIVSRELKAYSSEYRGERTLRKHMDIAWDTAEDKPGGFEHTFFGVKKRGMHSWLRIAHLIVTKDRAHHGKLFRRDWPRTFATNHFPTRHSAFLGYVPEFDVLIYTALHLISAVGRQTIGYRGVDLKLMISSDSKSSPITSAFPICES